MLSPALNGCCRTRTNYLWGYPQRSARLVLLLAISELSTLGARARLSPNKGIVVPLGIEPRC